MSNLYISSPCAADWNAMTPAAAGRHCAECGKNVVDLTCLAPAARDSALKRLELAVATGRSICVRTPASNDGQIAGRSLHRRVLTGGMATILAMTMAGCQGEGPVNSTASTAPVPQQAPPVQTQQPPVVEPLPQHVLMGAIAAPPVVNPAPPVPLTMGKVSRIDPLQSPVVQPQTPTPVMMGEMCITPPSPTPATVEPITSSGK